MEGTVISDNRKVGEIFNEYFIDVGKNIITNTKPIKFIPDRHLTPLTEGEVLKNIKKLKTKSAPGEDLLSARIIKEIGYTISSPLAFIFNLSIEKGVYPDALKKSIVTPVYKNSSVCDPNNYRPISVINNFSKIFEMSVKQRLNDH